MKKSTKVLLIISLCMIFAGIVICGTAVFMADFDFDRLSPVTYRERVTTLDEVFTDVDVYSQSADIMLFPSSSDEWWVESTETDKIYHQITVEDGTLTIRRVDDREWYEYIGFNLSFTTESIKIYLPHRMYEDIELKSTGGKVIVNEGITCESLIAQSTSGAVKVYSVSAEEKIIAKATSGQVTVDNVSTGELEASSTSGRVTVSNIESVDSISINATSGKVEATDINCRSFNAENVSGGITCSGVIAEDSLTAETTSGSIKILQSDAQTLSLKSTSGSVRGTLLSGKYFIADTASGSISVPESTQGGVCNVKTTSGSINITVE